MSRRDRCLLGGVDPCVVAQEPHNRRVAVDLAWRRRDHVDIGQSEAIKGVVSLIARQPINRRVERVSHRVGRRCWRLAVGDRRGVEAPRRIGHTQVRGARHRVVARFDHEPRGGEEVGVDALIGHIHRGGRVHLLTDPHPRAGVHDGDRIVSRHRVGAINAHGVESDDVAHHAGGRRVVGARLRHPVARGPGGVADLPLQREHTIIRARGYARANFWRVRVKSRADLRSGGTGGNVLTEDDADSLSGSTLRRGKDVADKAALCVDPPAGRLRHGVPRSAVKELDPLHRVVLEIPALGKRRGVRVDGSDAFEVERVVHRVRKRRTITGVRDRHGAVALNHGPCK